MKSCNMAVIVPVDKLAGNDEVLRAQVWGKVSELLLPALGKLYRQFNPSNGAWGLKLVRPFGVILGKQEPEQFLALFLAGQQAQQDAMEFHLSAMIEKTDMSNAQKIGDSLVCPMIVDGKDPELMAHAIWHISLQKGAPLPDWHLLHRTWPCGSFHGGAASYSGKSCWLCPLHGDTEPGGADRCLNLTRNALLSCCLLLLQKNHCWSRQNQTPMFSL